MDALINVITIKVPLAPSSQTPTTCHATSSSQARPDRFFLFFLPNPFPKHSIRQGTPASLRSAGKIPAFAAKRHKQRHGGGSIFTWLNDHQLVGQVGGLVFCKNDATERQQREAKEVQGLFAR